MILLCLLMESSIFILVSCCYNNLTQHRLWGVEQCQVPPRGHCCSGHTWGLPHWGGLGVQFPLFPLSPPWSHCKLCPYSSLGCFRLWWVQPQALSSPCRCSQGLQRGSSSWPSTLLSPVPGLTLPLQHWLLKDFQMCVVPVKINLQRKQMLCGESLPSPHCLLAHSMM